MVISYFDNFRTQFKSHLEEQDSKNFEKFVTQELKLKDKIHKIKRNKEKYQKYQRDVNQQKYEQWYQNKNVIEHNAEAMVSHHHFCTFNQ